MLALAQPRRRHTRRSLLELLPVASVAEAVLTFLDERSVLRCAATCKGMLELCESDVVWRALWARRLGPGLAPPVAQVKREVARRARESERGVAARLRGMLERVRSRAGLDHSLHALMEALQPELSVTLDGRRCELLGFRRRRDEVSRVGFSVHGAAPATDVDDGALRFPLSTTLKVLAPGAGRSVEVRVRCAKLDGAGPGGARRAALVLRTTLGAVPSELDEADGHGRRVRSAPCGRASSVLWNSDAGAVESDSPDDLLVLSVHHGDVLAALKVPGLGLAEHTSVPDDVDRRYGLHGYTCAVALRSLGQTWWSATFRDVLTRDALEPCAEGRRLRFPLLASAGGAADVTRCVRLLTRGGAEAQAPLVYYRTEAFSGEIKDACVLDVALWDEHGELFWGASRATRAAPPPREPGCFDHDPQRAFRVVCAEPHVARLGLDVTEQAGRLIVSECWLELDAARIARWFARG